MARNRAVGIVIRGEDLLVVRRIWKGTDYVVFPGGGIEEGESPEEAVIREIKEETSIDASVEKLLYRLAYDTGSLHHFFLCSYIAGEPKLGDSNEKELMATGEAYYEPKWLRIKDLADTGFLPAQVKEWLMHDLVTNFSDLFPKDGSTKANTY